MSNIINCAVNKGHKSENESSSNKSEHKKELDSALHQTNDLIVQKLDEIENLLSSFPSSNSSKSKNQSPWSEAKITTIVGPPADNMINSLKRGQAFSYLDKSVEGVPILEVWAEVDKDFWWDWYSKDG